MKRKSFTLYIFVLSLFFITACASTGKTEDGNEKKHPRSYIVNPYDFEKSLSLKFNEYYFCYEGKIDAWDLLKEDKPIAGDKIIVKGQLRSTIDIPNISVYLEDSSYYGNYCTVLSADKYITEVKAGVNYDFELEFPVLLDSKGGLSVVFAYDGNNHGMESAAKIGKASTLFFNYVEDVETTNTNPIVIEEEIRESQIFNIALEKIIPFLELKTRYPNVFGVEDMSIIDNYQVTPEITYAFNGNLPRKGDVINVTWSAYSNVKIRQIYARPVDCSSKAGGWKELVDVDWDYLDKYIIARSVRPNESFMGNVSFRLEKDAVESVYLCIWYDIGDAYPEGPAIIKMSK